VINELGLDDGAEEDDGEDEWGWSCVLVACGSSKGWAGGPLYDWAIDCLPPLKIDAHDGGGEARRETRPEMEVR
jgi:hypothetical protein